MAIGEVKTLVFSDGVTVAAPAAGSTTATYIDLPEASAPAAPAASTLRVYGKTDDNLYFQNSAGNEQQVGSGSGEKNYIATGPSTSAGWTTTGTVAAATDTTASIPRPNTTKTAVKLTSGAAADYAYKRFTLDDADFNKKLKIQFDQDASVGTDWKVEIYSNTASNYGGTSTRLALSTDSAAVSLLPGLTGTYRTTFDSPGAAAKWLELRFVRVANASALYVSDLVVGPGVVTQGAAVTDWISYTPTWTGFGTVTSPAVYYKRIGRDMYLDVTFTAGTLTATNSLMSLPAGLTIDTAVVGTQAIPIGVFGSSSNTQTINGLIKSGDTTDIGFCIQGNAFQTLSTATFSGTAFTSMVGPIPIAQWAGSGTVNVVQNDVEYQSNSSTSGSSDTTSFVAGSAGSIVPTITASTGSLSINKRVQFSTPIQATDQLVLQFQDSGTGSWLDIQNNDSYFSPTFQATTAYGVGLIPIDSTHVDVAFYPGGRVSTGATLGTAGASYPRNASDRWRVKKFTGGQAVGFSNATSTQAGLISGSAATQTIAPILDVSASTAGVKIETGRASPSTSDSQNVYSGTYTPTWTNSSNTSALTPGVANWYRVGQMVTVFGTGTFNNAGGTLTFTCSVPIAIGGTFASPTLAAGTASVGGTNNTSFYIIANTGGTNVIFSTVGAANNGATIGYQFSYKIQ